MTSASTSMSVLQIPSRKFISRSVKQRLITRIASTQGIETHLSLIDIYLATNQAMLPVGRHFYFISEHDETTFIIGAANVDDSASHITLLLALPLTGEFSAIRCSFDPGRFAFARGFDILLRLFLHLLKAFVFKSAPYFRLPQAIVAFYAVLQSVFSWRCKDWHNSKRQTKTNDSTYRVRMLMRATESVVVVKLSVVWQTDLAPMLKYGYHSRFRVIGVIRERADQRTVQRNDVEDFHVGFAANGKPLNEIKLIKFSFMLSDILQVPSLGRRRATDPAAVIKCAVAVENAPYSSQGRQSRGVARLHLATDCKCSELAKSTFFFKLITNAQHSLLNLNGCAISNSLGRFGSRLETSAIKALTFSFLNPTLNGRWRDPKQSSDGSNRFTTTNSLDHLATALLGTAFYS